MLSKNISATLETGRGSSLRLSTIRIPLRICSFNAEPSKVLFLLELSLVSDLLPLRCLRIGLFSDANSDAIKSLPAHLILLEYFKLSGLFSLTYESLISISVVPPPISIIT